MDIVEAIAQYNLATVARVLNCSKVSQSTPAWYKVFALSYTPLVAKLISVEAGFCNEAENVKDVVARVSAVFATLLQYES